MEIKCFVVSSAPIVCAARHFKAAHESACTGTPVDFGAVCSGCGEWEQCKGDWMKTAAPIFDAADVWPNLVRPFPE